MRTTLRNARLPDGRLVDLEVVHGVVAAVADADAAAGPPGAGTARAESGAADDLGGLLVLPAPAEPHAHLDKAFTAERVPNPTGDLIGAVDAWLAARPGLSTEDVVERATAGVRHALVHGHTAIRTHVDVGEGIELRALEALIEVRERFRDRCEVQVVLFPTSPLTGEEGASNRRWFREALSLTVDVVGGCPALDPRPGEVIAMCLDAAEELGRPLDLHVDETLDPSMLCLPELARQVVERGFEHGVTASHCVSLGVQPPERQAEVAAMVAAAGISVVALPQTNLYLQGRDVPSATPRGLTAVGALRSAGVRVAAGGDNVQDPFNLVGRGDPLETASLMVMAGHLLPADAYATVSTAARAAMGLPPAGPEVGSVADLLAVDAASPREAVAAAPMVRRTYRAGRLVARADCRTEVL